MCMYTFQILVLLIASVSTIVSILFDFACLVVQRLPWLIYDRRNLPYLQPFCPIQPKYMTISRMIREKKKKANVSYAANSLREGVELVINHGTEHNAWAGQLALHQLWNNDQMSNTYFDTRSLRCLYRADDVVWQRTDIHHGTPTPSEFLKYRESFYADARLSIFPCPLLAYKIFTSLQDFYDQIESRTSVIFVWMLLHTYYNQGSRRHRCRSLILSGSGDAVIVAKGQKLETSQSLKRVFTQYFTARTNVSTYFSFTWTYITAVAIEFRKKRDDGRGPNMILLIEIPGRDIDREFRRPSKCWSGSN